MSCYPPDRLPAYVLDFPRGSPERASAIAKALMEAGVEEVCLEGGATIPGGYRVLGRGHAAVVLLAKVGRVGDAAIKVRRSDSKRDSLLLECKALRTAWPVAPRVYQCTDEFIIMDLVTGSPVVDMVRSVSGCGKVLALIAKIAEAARWLDRVGVCHEELSDLRGHAFIGEGGEVKFIDFESASMRFCCTVCKVISWALHRSPLMKACPRLGLVKDEVRVVLRAYKRSPGKGKFLALIKALAGALRT